MFTAADAERVAYELFGRSGAASRMPGELDHNFHIKTDTDQAFLLKISHSHEQHGIAKMQNDAMRTVQADNPPFLSPAPQLTLSGDCIGEIQTTAGQKNLVRLFSFVPGELFAHARPHSEALLNSLGHQLGHLSRKLQDFRHPQAARVLKWDLKQASWIREYLQAIEDQESQQQVAHCLAHFEATVAPLLPDLRHSVIHGDINDYNVVVCATKVSGFIDFGDLVETSTVCELAIALTYAIMDNPNPLAAAATIIKAYHAVFPLEAREINLLFDLITMRLCTSVVNSAVRKKENPSDPYLVISEKPAWKLLNQLQGTDASFARDLFRRACGLDHDGFKT